MYMYQIDKKVHVHLCIPSIEKYMYMYYNKTIEKEQQTDKIHEDTTMMTINHRKTYTLDVEITKIDEEYAMFRDAYDNADSEPFKYIEEIGDIIEKELKPLVPFKKVYSWGYRLNVIGRNEDIKMTVTFNLARSDIDIIAHVR